MTDVQTRAGAEAAAVKAETVMRRQVLTVDAQTSVADVWEAMRTAQVEHAVVREQGTCLGIVALSQMWVAWSLELGPVSARSVLPLVTPAPCVSGDTALPQLCQILLRSRFGAALVLDDDGGMLGLVTADDVLSGLAHLEESCSTP